MSLYQNEKGAKQANINTMMELMPKRGASDIAAIEVLRKVMNASYDWFNNGGGNDVKWFEMSDIKTLVNSMDISQDGKKGAIKAIKLFRDGFTKNGAPKKVIDKERTQSFMQVKKFKHSDEEVSGMIDNAFDAIGAILFKDLETKVA